VNVDYLTGDLFATADRSRSENVALAHGVNCRGVMGAGIAVQFRARWRRMYEHYSDVCARGGMKPGNCLAWRDPESLVTIYNMASQDQPGRTARVKWVRDSLLAALGHAEETGVHTLAMPRIGCGIGGLNFDGDLVPLLDNVQALFNVQIVVCSPSPDAYQGIAP
jgi:O-acetyl-ADP-ribose deacetylase (regulator of RNase III)